MVEVEGSLDLRADARRRRPAYTLPPGQLDAQPALTVYLDPGRLTRAQALDAALHIHRIAQRQRLAPAIGLAAGRFTARVAAASLAPHEALIIPRQREADFLAGYPVSLLPVDGETLRQLHLLGLTTLGRVAALPAAALLDRFGAQGRVMHRLASGRDSSPVPPYVPRRALSLSAGFEPPAESWTILEARLDDLAERLAARLQADALAAREMIVTLHAGRGPALEQAVAFRQPASSSAHLRRTALELLAGHEPARRRDGGRADARRPHPGSGAAAQPV